LGSIGPFHLGINLEGATTNPVPLPTPPYSPAHKYIDHSVFFQSSAATIYAAV